MPFIARIYERMGTAPRPHHHPRGGLLPPCPLPLSALQTLRIVPRLPFTQFSAPASLRRLFALRLRLSPSSALVLGFMVRFTCGHDRRGADSCAWGFTPLQSSLHPHASHSFVALLGDCPSRGSCIAVGCIEPPTAVGAFAPERRLL